ncbi:MAG: ABC transporter ATP-binding protein [Leclercia adecarboxylata]|nr:ABC transporter ATP-binding protein [Leclercia adecarboxylata]
MSEPLLAFRDVDVFYGVIQALKQVSLEVNKGETVALIGANGAGKSTLLMSIFGQPRIRNGQILFGGEDISHKSTHYVASGGIAQAPEGRRIFPDMTVEENLLLDEPSLGLAPIVVKQIFQTLRELARNGMTIFLVEQNAHHALKLSDRGYVLVNGQIRLSGSGEELLGNQEVRKAYLGGV